MPSRKAHPELTEENIRAFKLRLLEEQGKLTGQVSRTKEALKEGSEEVIQGAAAGGSDESALDVNLEVVDGQAKKLSYIVRALEKIDEKSYGICDSTEEFIPLKRLDYLPWACYTIKAQEEIEKTGGY